MKTRKSGIFGIEFLAKLGGTSINQVASLSLIIPMALGAASASAATQQMISGPIAPQIDITNAILAGTGCALSEDSLSTIATQEGTVVALGFTRMSLSGTGRTSCVLRVPISIPAGYMAIVSSGEPNGLADIEAGDTITIASRLMIGGFPARAASDSFRGPFHDSFGPNASGSNSSVFQSPYQASTQCAAEATSALLGLNIAASGFLSTSAQVTITDASIGVQIVPCP